MKYTVLITDEGYGERTIKSDAESVESAASDAQCHAASDRFTRYFGKTVDPTDGKHDEAWMATYDRVPVVAVIEHNFAGGEPTIHINDDIWG